MKAVFQGRLHDGTLGFGKKLRRTIQTTAVDVFHAGHPRVPVKKAHEMGAAEMTDSGKFIYGKIFHIMRLNMIQNLLLLL